MQPIRERAGRLANPPGPAQGTVFRSACPRADAAVLTAAAGHPMRRRWEPEVGASLPLLRDAPTVSVLGDTEHLA